MQSRNGSQKNNILLSTTHTLDGYIITQYIDIISSEVVYKVSFPRALSQMLTDTVDNWKIFSNNELRGTTALIQEAKDYVKNDLIEKAKDLGANAVVGIDIETSISNDGVAKASINGTAVKIVESETNKSPEEMSVKNYNPDLSFRVRRVTYVHKNGSSLICLHLVSNSSDDISVSALKASIRFETVLGDSFVFSSLNFTEFHQDRHELISSEVAVDCSSEILSSIRSVEVIIEKYVQNDVLKTASDNNTTLDLQDTDPDAEDTAVITALIYTLENMESASEILKYLNTIDSTTIHPEVFSLAKTSAQYERMYGNMKKDCIEQIKKFYNLSDQN